MYAEIQPAPPIALDFCLQGGYEAVQSLTMTAEPLGLMKRGQAQRSHDCMKALEKSLPG